LTVELPPWAIASEARREHIARVTALVEAWARARGVDAHERARWREAARLHDALRDATPEQLARWAPQGDWPLKLWHGPAAAGAAAAHGCADRGVLEAIRYHSVGFRGWDDAGRMLFLADYLEPGRAHDRSALDALAARVPAEPEAVLREVVQRRIRWAEQAGKPVRPETRELWTSLG
jgi:HD superfamily phosphohydrolase YqeK